MKNFVVVMHLDGAKCSDRKRKPEDGAIIISEVSDACACVLAFVILIFCRYVRVHVHLRLRAFL